MSGRRIRPSGRARGRVAVPASKSLTNRHLNLALLAGRPALLVRPLLSDDTRCFLGALRAFGFAVSGGRQLLTLIPAARRRRARIDCGASGTMLRFVTAALATVEGEWTVDGTARLRERPIAGLVTALRQLGGRIRYRGVEGAAPLEISGGALEGGAVAIDGGQSSQFVSALVMAATRAEGPVSIEVEGLVSRPYVDLTLEALAAWGVTVDCAASRRFEVRPQRLEAGRIAIEADVSSACYFAAGAALCGGEVTLTGLSASSAQGDRGFLEILAAMGATLEWDREVLTVRAGGELTAVEVDMSDLPDQVPTLAALAPFARGTTAIRNVSHLRLKESDRLQALVDGLEAAGAIAHADADALVVPGVWATTEPPTRPVLLETADDHRIAMSLALLGLRRPGVTIAEPQVVEKSYPLFWHDFAACFEEPKA